MSSSRAEGLMTWPSKFWRKGQGSKLSPSAFSSRAVRRVVTDELCYLQFHFCFT